MGIDDGFCLNCLSYVEKIAQLEEQIRCYERSFYQSGIEVDAKHRPRMQEGRRPVRTSGPMTPATSSKSNTPGLSRAVREQRVVNRAHPNSKQQVHKTNTYTYTPTERIVQTPNMAEQVRSAVSNTPPNESRNPQAPTQRSSQIQRSFQTQGYQAPVSHAPSAERVRGTRRTPSAERICGSAQRTPSSERVHGVAQRSPESHGLILPQQRAQVAAPSQIVSRRTPSVDRIRGASQRTPSTERIRGASQRTPSAERACTASQRTPSAERVRAQRKTTQGADCGLDVDSVRTSPKSLRKSNSGRRSLTFEAANNPRASISADTANSARRSLNFDTAHNPRSSFSADTVNSAKKPPTLEKSHSDRRSITVEASSNPRASLYADTASSARRMLSVEKSNTTRRSLNLEPANTKRTDGIKSAVGKAPPPRTPSHSTGVSVLQNRSEPKTLDDVRCKITISLDDNAVSFVDVGLTLKQDGPFLYLVDNVPVPPFRLRLAALKDQITPDVCVEIFKNFSVGVVAMTDSGEALIFQSHQSHVDKPPVSSVDESLYFSHSCWLSGGSTSLVAGVRVFLDLAAREDQDNTYDLVMNRCSLKFWYPESEGTDFSSVELEQFLTSLEILP